MNPAWVKRGLVKPKPGSEYSQTQWTLSENTVKGHVSNILGKLHLADRTQAAVYAWREGLVRKSST